MDKMAPKVPTSSISRPSKIDPNWDFWFGNIASGNTGHVGGDISSIRRSANKSKRSVVFGPARWDFNHTWSQSYGFGIYNNNASVVVGWSVFKGRRIFLFSKRTTDIGCS
jgi:hypothetical protein